VTTPLPSLSLAHATLLDLSPHELIRVAAATGYSMVGLRLIPIDRPGEPRHLLPAGSSAMRDVKQLLADTSIRVLDVEVAIIREGVNPRDYLPMLEASAELGATYLLTNVYTTDRGAAVEGLRTLCDLSAPFGLAPVVEFVSFSAVPALADAVDLMEAAGRPEVGILFDMLHFHSTHGTPADLGRLPAGRLAYVHMDDGPHEVPATIDERRRIAREARLLPGEGGADFAGVIPLLPAHVPYAVEVTNPARAREMGAEAYARLGFEMTARCLQAFRKPIRQT
jgi:sugar phosphate isomerase/epimerase